MQTTHRKCIAKFNGFCRKCEKKILKGSIMVGSKKNWYHEDCAKDLPVEVKSESTPAPAETRNDTPAAATGMNPLALDKMIRKIVHEEGPNLEFDFTLDEADLKPALQAVAALRSEYETQIEALRKELAAVKTAKSGGTFKLEIEIAKVPATKLDAPPHACFDEVLTLAANREEVLLIGPAGCGKTYLGEQVAKALKLDFGFISCSTGMSEGHLTGRLLPTGKGGAMEYHATDFVRCYENGGVFLIDEVDAADPNVMLVLNAALANGFLPLPNRVGKPIAKRHKDFVCLAAANTFGRGADRLYVGRNQLDEATLDRFRCGQIEMDYDRDLERRLCPDAGLLDLLHGIRDKVIVHKMRRVVSTRFIIKAYKMKQVGWTNEKIKAKLLCGWSADEIAKL